MNSKNRMTIFSNMSSVFTRKWLKTNEKAILNEKKHTHATKTEMEKKNEEIAAEKKKYPS